MDHYPQEYLEVFTMINGSKAVLTIEQFPDHLKPIVLGMSCLNILTIKDDFVTIRKRIPRGFKQQWKEYNHG